MTTHENTNPFTLHYIKSQNVWSIVIHADGSYVAYDIGIIRTYLEEIGKAFVGVITDMPDEEPDLDVCTTRSLIEAAQLTYQAWSATL